jgi:hypothetical protein
MPTLCIAFYESYLSTLLSNSESLLRFNFFGKMKKKKNSIFLGDGKCSTTGFYFRKSGQLVGGGD